MVDVIITVAGLEVSEGVTYPITKVFRLEYETMEEAEEAIDILKVTAFSHDQLRSQD